MLEWIGGCAGIEEVTLPSFALIRARAYHWRWLLRIGWVRRTFKSNASITQVLCKIFVCMTSLEHTNVAIGHLGKITRFDLWWKECQKVIWVNCVNLENDLMRCHRSATCLTGSLCYLVLHQTYLSRPAMSCIDAAGEGCIEFHELC